MLKLRRMELSGFKSFFQKTTLSFTDGITAVVGPNGCGKSNLSDAISWVLGEQSSKSLRGSKMEDVIFNGSEKRGPLPMAEVTLTLAWSGNGSDLQPMETDRFYPRPPVLDAGEALDADQPTEKSLSASSGDPLDGVPGPATGDGGRMDGHGRGNGHVRRPVFNIPTQEGASISVSRRLYRSGESEYRINGTRCRLKDIQDLMNAACVGTRTSAVIEQDRISSLLSAPPKVRREIIEEAAGILGFKARKRSALLKLQSAEMNLSRLRDLIDEVRRQVNSLKRQASRARRYRQTAGEMRRFRRALVSLQARNLLGRLETLSRELSARQAAETEAGALNSRQESVVAALRQRIDEEGHGAAERRESLHRSQREVDRLTASLEGLAERIVEAQDLALRLDQEAHDLEERSASTRQRARQCEKERSEAAAELERLEAGCAGQERTYTARLAAADEAAREDEAHRSRLLSAVAHLGEAKNRSMQMAERGARLFQQRERLERERRECAEEIKGVEGRLAEAARAIEEAAQALAAAQRADADARAACQAARRDTDRRREALASARRTLDALEERVAALNSLWKPLEDEEGGARPVGAPLGEGIEVAGEWEKAAGAWTEGMMRARVVAHVDDAVAALETARKSGRGPLRLVVPGMLKEGGPASDPALSQVLAGDTQRTTLLAAATGDPLLVPDLQTAVERWREIPGRAFLTRSGDGITASGVFVGGGRGEGVELLACNRQCRQAQEAAAAHRASLPELEAAYAASCRRQQEAEGGADSASQGRENRDRDLLEHRLEHQRRVEERERLERRGQVIAGELQILAGDQEEQQREAEEAKCKQEEAERQRQLAQEAASASQAVLDRLRREIHSLATDLADRKSICAARREALAGMDEHTARLHTQAGDLAERGVQCAHRSREAREKRVVLEAEVERLRKARETALSLSSQLQEQCRVDEMTLQETRAALHEAEKLARESRQALETARQSCRAMEVERARIQADVEHLECECREEFGCDPESLRQQVGPEDRALSLEEIRSRLHRLEEIREKIGPVNMMAIEQHDEAEEREIYLKGQQTDLEESIRALNATIQKINRTSKERFLQALASIRTEFNRLFRQLFSGGHADIEILDPEDILESGIEIIAQPPGKRTRTINLLSGGEKSLSALALLFAIFKYRPSPFCLLDEVDAALDEGNVERFTRLLRDYGGETQFIMITHNRRSMEVADILYGVTMEEPGISQTVSLTLA
ncbi:MAG: chromosome segregation protein SMC [Acidobacteriota bacterium]